MNVVKGDLIQLAVAGQFDIIVHGCNCFCTMGSGIARTVRDRFPAAYHADKQTERGDVNKLHTYTSAEVGDVNKFVIINAYTQYRYNQTSERIDLFEYGSFESILDSLVSSFPGKRFGFPMIGMERAGGDKTRIVSMLEDFSNRIESTGGSVTLVEYNGVVNK